MVTIGKFSLGYYRLRNGQVAHLHKVHLINMVPHYFGHMFRDEARTVRWDCNGKCASSFELDLMEFLKVRENGTHEGPSVEDLFPLGKPTGKAEGREWD